MTISLNSDFSTHFAFQKRRLLLSFLFIIGLVSCSDPDSGDNRSIVFERCDGNKVSIELGTSIPIGSNANRLFPLDEKSTLVVESGENTVSKLANGTLLPFLDVGENRSPWSVWGDENAFYVTNYASDSISVFDGNGNFIEEWTEGFSSPSSIIGDDDYVYVSNVAFDGTAFQMGFTNVYDRGSKALVRTLESSALNPLFLSILSHQGVRYLGVVNAGSFEFTKKGTTLGSAASFDLWEMSELEHLSAASITTLLPLDIDRKIGSPGRPIQIDEAVFFTSATEPVLFEYSLSEKEWIRGVENPIRLRSPLPDALHFSTLWEGLILITAFNEDAMYLFDPECEKVSAAISLDDNVDYLAGPHDITVSSAGQGNLILSLANLVKPFTIEYIK